MERAGSRAICSRTCLEVQGGENFMLLFTFNIDLDGRRESVRDLEQRLTERTGEECLVLSFCTGVHRFPSEKERLDESGQRDGDGSDTENSLPSGL